MRNAYVQVNKFEQVSSADHQMSLAGWSLYGGEGGRAGASGWGETLYRRTHVDRQTHIKTVPSRKFFGGR